MGWLGMVWYGMVWYGTIWCANLALVPSMPCGLFHLILCTACHGKPCHVIPCHATAIEGGCSSGLGQQFPQEAADRRRGAGGGVRVRVWLTATAKNRVRAAVTTEGGMTWNRRLEGIVITW